MNLQPEFTRINGALSNCENGEKLSQDLAKIQQEYESMRTLADELSGLCRELIDDMPDGSRTQHDAERKFNQIMKVRK